MFRSPTISDSIDYGHPVEDQDPLTNGLLFWSIALPQSMGSLLCRDLVSNPVPAHGTLTNGPVWLGNGLIPRPGGWGCIQLDGTNDYVDLGSPAKLALTGSMTLSIWCLPQTDCYIIDKYEFSGSPGPFILASGWPFSSRNIDFGVTSTGTSVTAHLTSSTGIGSTTALNHFCCVYDAVAQTLNVYVNGLLANGTLTGTVPASQTTTGNAISWKIGARADGTSGLMQGYWDDACILGRALSADEVFALYEDGLRGHPRMLRRRSRHFLFKPSAGNVYTLSVGSGSYAVTGSTVGLAKANKLPIAAGSYAETGSTVGLAKGSKVAAGSGSFALTGSAVSLAKANKIPVGVGSFALTGTAVGLRRGYPLAALAGSYALTGTAVGLRHGYKVPVGAGAYALTGSAVTLTYSASGARTLAVGAGSFTLTGTAVTLTVSARTGQILLIFPGQVPHSWGDGGGLAFQTVGGVDYFLYFGSCEVTGNYLGGGGSFTGMNFNSCLMRFTMDGKIDRTFGTYGFMSLDLRGDDDEAGPIQILPSGKILLAMNAFDSISGVMSSPMLRFNADGTRDLQFGRFGVAENIIASSGRFQQLQVGLQSSGRIILGTGNAVTAASHRNRIARFHENGAPDTSFGLASGATRLGYLEVQPNGRDTPGNDYGGHFHVDSSDRIAVSAYHDVSGSLAHYEGLIFRVKADGSATDNTFGVDLGDGTFGRLIDFPVLNSGIIWALFPTAAGGYILCGNAKRNASNFQAGSAALVNSSGALVTTFSGDGILENFVGSLSSDYYFQPLQTSGGDFRFIGATSSMAGLVADSVTPTTYILAVAYHADGTLDTTWGTGGITEIQGNGMAMIFNALILSDDSILATGHYAYPTAPTIGQAAIIKLNPAGVLDPAWGDDASPPTPPTAPTCVTGAASSVTSTTATIAGTVNPNSTLTSYHFEWGLNASYGQRSAETGAGSGSSAVAGSVNLTGLIPGQTYHYRLVAFNGAIGYGSDATFNTQGGTFTLLSDSFTNTNGTDTRAHTGHAQTDYLGTAYKEVKGRGTVQGNKLRWDSDSASSSGLKNWIVQRDCYRKDVTVSLKWTKASGSALEFSWLSGPMVRMGSKVEFSNLWGDWIGAGYSHLNKFRIRSLVGSTDTIHAETAFTPVVGTEYTITISVVGNSASATLTDGASVNLSLGPVSLTAASALANNTQIGWIVDSSLNDTVDDFSVSAPLAVNYTLAADPGHFAFTGSALAMHKGFTLAIGAGAFTEAGSAVTLRWAHKLAALAGSHALTGQSVTLTRTRPLAVGAGSFALTGTAVGFRWTHAVTASAGSFTLAGQDVNLRWSAATNTTLTVGAGSFALTGTGVGLRRAYPLVALAGSYALTGGPVNFPYVRALAVGAGVYGVVGSVVGLTVRRRASLLRHLPTQQGGLTVRPVLTGGGTVVGTGRILVFQGEDAVQPFHINADLTGRALTLTVWDGLGAVVMTQTVGAGITVTDPVAGTLEVVVADSMSPLLPGRYTCGLSFSDTGAVGMLWHGRYTVAHPPAV